MILQPKIPVKFYFQTDVKNNKHLRSSNIQCLNATVSRKFVKKSAKLLGKYVELIAHLRSLDEANAPSKPNLLDSNLAMLIRPLPTS